MSASFTTQEITYLNSLDAVEHATQARITYADWFKRDCLQRYMNGESPVRMFRAAGLPPELVGYKRIERAFARWKKDERIMQMDSTPVSHNRDSIMSDFDGADLGTGYGNADEFTPPSGAPFEVRDVRDILIVQQIRRIAELEQQVDALKIVAAGRRNAAGNKVTEREKDSSHPEQ